MGRESDDSDFRDAWVPLGAEGVEMTKTLSFCLLCIFGAIVLVTFVALGHCQTKHTKITCPGGETIEFDGDLPEGTRTCVELPDAPSSVKTTWHYLSPEMPPEHARFWTVGRWDAKKPLRSNKETLRSWTFWAGETANWGSTFALVNVTRNEKQNPPIPRHGELYVDAFVPALAISGIHYLSDRYICRGVGLLVIAFASSWRGYEAVKGYYP